HEIQKTRPAVVTQNDVSNQYSPITIVAAISSQFPEPPFPREVVIEPADSGLPKRSAVIANQIRSVDQLRLQKKIGRLSRQNLERVDEAIKISLGLIQFCTRYPAAELANTLTDPGPAGILSSEVGKSDF